VMNFSNGASASFISSTGEAPGSNQLSLVGDLGTLIYDGKELQLQQLSQSCKEHCQNTSEMFSMPEVNTTIVNFGVPQNQHVQLIQDFVAAIQDGKKLTTDAVQASKSIELANGILLSAWTEKKISFPLNRTEFNSHFQNKYKNSKLREKEKLNVSIDLDKSFR